MGRNASGSIGGTLTAANYKGIGVLKEKANPSNPNTVAQQTQRGIFADVIAKWQSGDLTGDDQLAYNTLVSKTGKQMSGYNWFVSVYMKVIQAGNIPTYFTGVSSTTDGTNLKITVTGAPGATGVIKYYTTTGRFVFSKAVTYTGTTQDISEAFATVGYKGYVNFIATEAGKGGQSGYYAFDETP